MQKSEISKEYCAVIEKERCRRALLFDNCKELFLRYHPEVLEIGCGHGHFLSAYALAHPEQCCVGIDLKSGRLKKSVKKLKKLNTKNLFFLKAEGKEFIGALGQSIRFKRIFILFPDPWPKKRHHKRRLIQEDFLLELGDHASIGACIYFRTDFQPYFEWTSKMIEHCPNWMLDQNGRWPFEEKSYFEQIHSNYKSLIAKRI